MNFKDILLIYLLWNLVQVLQMVLGQLGELKPEDIHLPKAMRMAAVSPRAQHRGSPFENSDDILYGNEKFLRHQTSIKPVRVENRKPKTPQSNGNQPKATKDILVHTKHFTDESIQSLVNELKGLKDQVKEIKNLSRFLKFLKSKVKEDDTSMFSVNELSTKSNGGKRKKAGKKETERTTSKIMNNITYNNRYRIDSVFIINSLLKEKENYESESVKFRESEIIEEITAHELKEILEDALNNLNDKILSRGMEIDCPNLTTLPPEKETERIEKLEKKISEMFAYRNITLKEINQMSRIIDFIERYHGIISDLNTTEDSLILDEGKYVRNNEKVTREGFLVETNDEKVKSFGDNKKRMIESSKLDFFISNNSNKYPLVRRKGFS